MFDRNSLPTLNTHSARLVLLLLETSACYFWGLDSPFLFDDAPNLNPLLFIQEASLFSKEFWEFVFSGQSGPTGRPVSLFTFALQASAWPDNPWAVKSINLLVHCLNASLIYLISFQLSRVLGSDKSQGAMIALFTALAWALHPVHTSTVFYAVQRMALLSNLFILMGIYFHLCIRLKDFSRQPAKQILSLSFSLGITGLLALFSKENALSLVFYLLTLEYTVLGKVQTDKHLRMWRLIFLWLPAVIAVLLPLVYLETLQSEFAASFNFSMGERVLTESRIMWGYLAVLLLPTTSSIGIFQEIGFSTSLFSPLSTLISILGWLLLLILVLLKPGNHRLPAFALLWYFSGHLVESTVLPLELIFQHRNYLAYFGILFFLVFSFFTWTSEKMLPGKQKALLFSFYLVLLASNTVRVSTLWANPVLLAERWYETAPGIARNAEFYAIELLDYGTEGEVLAAGVINKAIEDNPDEFRLILNMMTIACSNPDIAGPEQNTILQKAGNLSIEKRNLVFPVQQIVDLSLQGNCPAYQPDFLYNLLEILGAELEGSDRGVILFNQARMKISTGETDEAIQLLETAYNVAEDTGILFNLAIQLIRAGRYQEALDKIDLAIQRTQTSNDIRTGTQNDKLETLAEMRRDVLDLLGKL